MWSARIGAGLATLCILWLGSVKFHALFMYLTSWGVILNLTSCLLGIFRVKNEFNRRLLIVNWTLGWQICVSFWTVVYPLLKPEQIPPMWYCILSHGGLQIPLTKIFFDSKIKVQTSDFLYPISVVLVYFTCVVIPLKFFGITIYPLFLEEAIPSILIITSALVLLYVSFIAAIHLTRNSSKVT